MKPPVPGLRPIHYSARSAAKVALVVQPGDTLVVSDDVADQLLRASQQFKDGAPAERPPTADVNETAEDGSEAEAQKPRRRAGKKSDD